MNLYIIIKYCYLKTGNKGSQRGQWDSRPIVVQQTRSEVKTHRWKGLHSKPLCALLPEAEERTQCGLVSNAGYRWKLPCCGSIAQSCLTLCDPMGDCSKPGFPVLLFFPAFSQTQIHWVDHAIQPSHPLSPFSPPAFNLSQHQGLIQWVGSSHQVAKVLELQLHFFQWIFRVDFI